MVGIEPEPESRCRTLSHQEFRRWSQSWKHLPGNLGVPQDPVSLLVQVGPGGENS